MSVLYRILFIVIISTLCCSCSNLYKDARASLNSNSFALWTKANTFQGSGSITYVKQVPKASDKLNNLEQQLFALKNYSGPALIIDRIAGTVELQNNKQIVQKIEGLSNLGRLSGGKFNIREKQRDPVWYAPDEYYQKRNLPVPAYNDKSRLLRGALGDYALFLDNDTIMHDGELWTSEVGGIRLKEQELAKLFTQIDVGTPVIIN